MVYYKSLDGRFFIGAGGEYGQKYFYDSTATTTINFGTLFVPRVLGLALVRIAGGGKGGGTTYFLEAEGAYRLQATAPTQTFASGLDFGGQLFAVIPTSRMDVRVGVRGILEGLTNATMQQQVLTFTGLVGISWR